MFKDLSWFVQKVESPLNWHSRQSSQVWASCPNWTLVRIQLPSRPVCWWNACYTRYEEQRPQTCELWPLLNTIDLQAQNHARNHVVVPLAVGFQRFSVIGHGIGIDQQRAWLLKLHASLALMAGTCTNWFNLGTSRDSEIDSFTWYVGTCPWVNHPSTGQHDSFQHWTCC